MNVLVGHVIALTEITPARHARSSSVLHHIWRFCNDNIQSLDMKNWLFEFLPLRDFVTLNREREREPLLCVRLPPCGRIENVHSGSAHAQFRDAGHLQGGG